MFLLQADNPDIVRALIVFGANVNAMDCNLHTPLHDATAGQQRRWQDIVRALGFVGAGPCDRSKMDCTLQCSKAFQGEITIGG